MRKRLLWYQTVLVTVQRRNQRSHFLYMRNWPSAVGHLYWLPTSSEARAARKTPGKNERVREYSQGTRGLVWFSRGSIGISIPSPLKGEERVLYIPGSNGYDVCLHGQVCGLLPCRRQLFEYQEVNTEQWCQHKVSRKEGYDAIRYEGRHTSGGRGRVRAASRRSK